MTTHEIMEDVEEADRDREAGPVLQFLAATVRLIISVAITLLGLVTLTFFISRLLPLDPVIAMLGTMFPKKPMTRCIVSWVSTSR